MRHLYAKLPLIKRTNHLGGRQKNVCRKEQNSAEILADEAASRANQRLRSVGDARDTRKMLLPILKRRLLGRVLILHCGRAAARAARRYSSAIVVGLIFVVAQAFPSPITSNAAFAVDAPEGNVKSQHGDWQVVCKDPPPGSKNPVCALVQSVTAEDKNNIGLTVYFQKFSNGTRVLRVFAPLGVLLPPGIGLKIDDKDVGHAPFLRCHSFACYAQVVVDDPLIERLKTGKTAIFIIFQTEEAGIGIPISLKGFGEAMGEIK